ncbi:MAG: bifunctional folylpolyglutamate synthase/dihydrofolate synthase [Dehalococcoidia bacterium]|nr:bifunctional folylpolyglutamate synthase/dihydrofolate synthase [Dehalococcoidia bacterium]
MSAVTYNDALAFLLERTDWERRSLGAPARGAWNLDRPRALLAALCHPQQRYPSVHIAGTKGKGSTAAFLESILRTAGLRTGLYTQPHLHDYRERVQINGEPIAQEALARTVRHLAPVAEQLEQETPDAGQLTTYELGTALAFQHFADAGVDWAVVEVGLGGRLDATNVLTPAVSAITALSLDHTALLGETLAAVAAEKAGIIKPCVPVVSTAQRPEPTETLTAIAAERDAPLTLGGRDFTWRGDHRAGMVIGDGWGYAGLELGLVGHHQLENAAVAVTVIEALRATAGLEVSTKAVRQGLLNVRWPGRLEVLQEGPDKPMVVCDGAHNGDSARRLAAAIRDWFPHHRLYLVVGSSADHDLAAIVAELRVLEPATVFAAASIHPRARPAEDVAAQARKAGGIAEAMPSVQAATRHAAQQAAPGDLVLATGSLFVAAEARAAFGRTSVGD